MEPLMRRWMDMGMGLVGEGLLMHDREIKSMGLCLNMLRRRNKMSVFLPLSCARRNQLQYRKEGQEVTYLRYSVPDLTLGTSYGWMHDKSFMPTLN